MATCHSGAELLHRIFISRLSVLPETILRLAETSILHLESRRKLTMAARAQRQMEPHGGRGNGARATPPLQTSNQAPTQRFSYMETPVEAETATFQPYQQFSSPTNSTIDESPSRQRHLAEVYPAIKDPQPQYPLRKRRSSRRRRCTLRSSRLTERSRRGSR